MNFDLARPWFEVFSTACAFVQRNSIHFDGGVFRRRLHNHSAQRSQHGFDIETFGHWSSRDDFAVRIIRVRRRSEHALGDVRLARSEQIAGDFRRLAEADRKETCSKWIETAGLARLACAEQMPNALQCLIGAQAFRLVEKKNSVDVAKRPLRSCFSQAQRYLRARLEHPRPTACRKHR